MGEIKAHMGRSLIRRSHSHQGLVSCLQPPSHCSKLPKEGRGFWDGLLGSWPFRQTSKGEETRVSNNSLGAYNKLTPQREGRGLAEKEDADLDYLGWKQEVSSYEMAAYTCQDLPCTLTPNTCH